MVPDIVSPLRLAEKDDDIGAVVVKINSPGRQASRPVTCSITS